ncbi:MAG: tyrosine-type recombinase/integrase [Leptospiraceae bacterium]|nr:tyrosine-type recombinase/integrase [Leptospiraceae bacterium]
MDDEIFTEGTSMYQTNLRITEAHESLDNSYFSKSEILEIISLIKQNYIHLIWFKLLYSFGMTLHELVNLKVKDVDIPASKLTIHTSKKLGARRLDIPKSLLCDLRIQCSHKQPDSYVFQGRTGKLHTRTIQKALEKTQCNLRTNLTIAKLRKSIAVHLLQSGWDYKSIGEFLGHSSYRATKNLLGPANYYLKSKTPLDEILA